MALTFTNKTTGIDNFAGTSFDTASHTPALDTVQILTVALDYSASSQGVVTVSGNGLTWTVVDPTEGRLDWVEDGARNNSLWVFYAEADVSNTGTTTITTTIDPSKVVWSIEEVDGEDAAAFIVQAKKGAAVSSSTAHTVTLDSSITGNNATYAAFATDDSTSANVDAPYTELASDVGDNRIHIATGYRVPGQTSASATFGAATTGAGIIIEVKEESSGLTITQDSIIPSGESVPSPAVLSPPGTFQAYPAGNSTDLTNQISDNHTLVAGTNRAVVIDVIDNTDTGSSPFPVITSVLYGGVAATLANTTEDDDTFDLTRIATYRILEADLPADGVNAFTVDWDIGSGTVSRKVYIRQFDDLDQTTPFTFTEDIRSSGTADLDVTYTSDVDSKYVSTAVYLTDNAFSSTPAEFLEQNESVVDTGGIDVAIWTGSISAANSSPANYEQTFAGRAVAMVMQTHKFAPLVSPPLIPTGEGVPNPTIAPGGSNASIVNIDYDTDGFAGVTVITPSHTPSIGTVILFSVIVDWGIDPTDTIDVSGLGLTWQLVDPVEGSLDWIEDSRNVSLRLFYAVVDSVNTGSITITHGIDPSQIIWAWDEISDVELSSPIEQVTKTEAPDPQAALTASLALPLGDANNVTFSVFANDDSTAITADPTYTILADDISTIRPRLLTQYKAPGEQSATVTLAGSDALPVAILVEVKSIGSGTSIIQDATIASQELVFPDAVVTRATDPVTLTQDPTIVTGEVVPDPTVSVDSLALDITNKASGADVFATTTVLTASHTPTINSVQIVTVGVDYGAAVTPDAVSLAGNGITWQLIDPTDGRADFLQDTRNAQELVFYGIATTSTPGIITITLVNEPSKVAWAIDEAIGADLVTPIVNTTQLIDPATVTTAPLTLDAALSDPENVTFFAFANDNNRSWTADAPTESLSGDVPGSNIHILTGKRNPGNITGSATMSGSGKTAVIGFELAASAPQDVLFPPLIASGEVVSVPTVSKSFETISPGLIASLAQVYAPTNVGDPFNLKPAIIASGILVPNPTVAVETDLGDIFVDDARPDDSGDGLTPATAKKTISAGMALASPADVVFVANGTYAGSLNDISDVELLANPGTLSDYVVLRGETAGQVIITANLITAQTITTPAYWRFENLEWRSRVHKITEVSYLDFKKCSFYGAEQSTNSPETYVFARGNNHLYEDCIFYGPGGRYKFQSFAASELVLRRCVFRNDGGWDGSAGNPEAPVMIYSTSNVRLFNCISVDAVHNADSPTLAALAGTTNSFGNGNNVQFVGCVALNTDFKGIGFEGIDLSADNVEYRHTISINNTVGAAFNTQAPTMDNLVVNNNVFANNQNKGLFFGDNSVYTGALENNIIYNNVSVAFDRPSLGSGSVITDLNNNAFGNVNNPDDLNLAETTTYDPTANGMLYPTRVETGSQLAIDSIGPQDNTSSPLLYNVGPDGSRWGDPQLEVVQTELLWPFKEEAWVRERFRTVLPEGSGFGATEDGKRGFAADGAISIDGNEQTLTKYIWEQFGNQIPNDVYNGIFPPAISSGESVPNPTVEVSTTIFTPLIPSGELVFNPDVFRQGDLRPTTVPSGESVPTPTLVVPVSPTILPPLIPSGEQVPGPVVNIGSQLSVSPTFISSGESVENATVTLAVAPTILPPLIPSAIVVPTPTVAITDIIGEFDTFPVGNGVEMFLDQISGNYNLVSGLERVVVIVVVDETAGGPSYSDITSVTYGGSTATLAGTTQQANPGNTRINRIKTYQILEANLPADGVNSLVVDWAAGGVDISRKVYAWQFSAVSQITPLAIGGDTEASGGDQTVSIPYTFDANADYISVANDGNPSAFTTVPTGFTEQNRTVGAGISLWAGATSPANDSPAVFTNTASNRLAGVVIQLNPTLNRLITQDATIPSLSVVFQPQLITVPAALSPLVRVFNIMGGF